MTVSTAAIHWGVVVVRGEKWWKMLTGNFPRALDDKGRVAVPKELRQGLVGEKSAVFVCPGHEGSIAVFAETALELLAITLGDGFSRVEHARAFQRLFYAQAQRVEFDAQGRLRIPTELAKLAGLQGEVMLLGVRDHLEIWPKPRWDEYLARMQPLYDKLAERRSPNDPVGFPNF
ncbi:MAG: hypothetical protein QM811_13965 [Pirellulales bacterium]